MKSIHDDECSYLFEALQTTIDIFYNNFNLYMNKASKKFQSTSDMEELTKLSSNLDVIVCDVYRKFRSYNDHKCLKCNLASDVQQMKTTFNRLLNLYQERKIVLLSRPIDDEQNESAMIIEDYFTENIKSNTNDQYQLELDFKEYEEYSKDDLDQINAVKTQIKDIINSINTHIKQGTHVINQIDCNVEYSVNNVDKINEEFRKAAISKNKTSKIKYPLLIGSILGAAGSFVPGVGNAIGAGLGLGVGYAIAKVEEKSIKNIEPEKYKL